MADRMTQPTQSDSERIAAALAILESMEINPDGGPWWHVPLAEVVRILKGDRA
jgi:hypothetical protein